jgi:hypothetical protein
MTPHIRHLIDNLAAAPLDKNLTSSSKGRLAQNAVLWSDGYG